MALKATLSEAKSLKRQNDTENELQVIQFNCNSLLNKLPEIKLYIYTKKPEIVCLCETFIKKGEPKFIGYYHYWKHRDSHKGGLATLVRKDLASRIKLLTPYKFSQLEYQCIQIYSKPDWIDILNIYNPQKPISSTEFLHYSSQLSSAAIIIGDMNAHSPIWDMRGRSNYSGRTLEDFLTNSNYGLLNKPSVPTYINDRSNTTSCLDLCFATRQLFAIGSLKRGPDLGSDHFPIECTFHISVDKCAEETPKRWKYSKADWREFSEEILSHPKIILPSDANSIFNNISTSVQKAAEKAIGRTSGRKALKRHFSGWDAECTEVAANRRSCRRKLWKQPTPDNLIEWKKAKAQARYTMKKKRQESFMKFIDTINCNTPSRTIWKKIKSIGGHSPSSPGGSFCDPSLNMTVKADLFAEHFTRFKKPSSSGKFATIHEDIAHAEFEPFPPVTIQEISSTIQKLKNTSPGKDEISNQLIKKFPPQLIEDLTSLFNVSLHSGKIPDGWKEGITVPILKPGRDSTMIKSYRPITMLSCVGKLMERVVKKRMDCFLESNKILHTAQMGFRQGRSTTEALAVIFQDIKNSLKGKRQSIAVYIDLESAFDCVWHEGLLYKMQQMKVPNYLLRWFSEYFKNRKTTAKLNTVISSERNLEVGVPQGAVLSPLFFNIMLSDIPTDKHVRLVSYADDITFVSSSESLSEARNNMQKYISTFTTWLTTWKLNINPQKSTFQIFSNKRSIPPVTLRMLSHNLRLVDQQRVLGVIFDAPKLSFAPHFKAMNIECRKRLHTLRALSSTNWGCSRILLRRLYVAYIRSKMEYASVLFTDVSPKLIHKLDLIQNEAMRCILGSRRTSPILSLQVEIVLPPMNLRFKQLLIKWSMKVESSLDLTSLLKTSPGNNHWSFNKIFGTVSSQMCLTKWKLPASEFQDVEPWINLSELVSLDLPVDASMTTSSNAIFNDHVAMQYPGFCHIYTDGSKLECGSCASAIYVPEKNLVMTYRMNPAHTILGAELFAILKAVEHAEEQGSDSSSNFVILSDSQSALQCITNISNRSYKSITPLIQQSLCKRKNIKLQWVRAHCNIKGNEVADRAAHFAHNNTQSTRSFLSREESLICLENSFAEYWRKTWKTNVVLSRKGKFLSEHQNKILNNSWIQHKSRRLESAITRLRIGHAGVNAHLNRFEMSDSPLCQRCSLPETIEHFLMTCPTYQQQRSSLRETFQNSNREFSLRNVLCFGEFPRGELLQQLDALAIFLRNTGRMSSI